MRFLSLCFALLLTCIALAACGGGGGAASGGKPVVVCTIFSYYDAARAIAGDKARVEILLPTSESPHEMQATPGDRALIYKASLYVKNGLGLDDRFDGMLEGSHAKVLTIGNIV